jgi:ElaB/YqjD/DUF883 family membrane-anchored ribosome-binding protein
MAAAQTPLPEGTDHIINGASESGDDTVSTATDTGATSDTSEDTAQTSGSARGGTDTRGAFFDKFEEVKAQGVDRAREYAVLGKDRTTGALDDFIRMINDTAGQVDSKVGSQYGDYARRAADGLASFNDALKGKDVDDLFNDAREMVAKAPAIAVGTAAALGFIVARLAKAGLDTGSAPADKDASSV